MASPQIFSSFQYSENLTVVAISFCTAIVCEAISCINSYKLRSSINKASLKESSRDLSLFKFKSGIVVTLVPFVVFGLLNSLFLGFSPPRGPRSGLFLMPDPKTN